MTDELEHKLDEAETALDHGDAELALELCTQVLVEIPDYAGAHFVRGDALRVLGDMYEAAEAYRMAALLRPDHAASCDRMVLPWPAGRSDPGRPPSPTHQHGSHRRVPSQKDHVYHLNRQD